MRKQLTPNRRLKQQSLFHPGRRRDSSVIRTGCETSDAAADRVETHAGTQKHRIFEAICAAGERGLTALELESSLGLSGSSVRPRLLELLGKRFVQFIFDDAGKPVQRDGARIYILVPGRVLHVLGESL